MQLQTSKWEMTYRGKRVIAIGNKKMYDWLHYLANTPLENIPKRYKFIENAIGDLLNIPKRPLDTYEYLLSKEFMLSKYMVRYIDRQFLDSKLSELNILDDFQMIFDSFSGGTSASTSIYGKHVLIKIDVFKFVNWIDTMHVHKAKSIGNGCSHIIACMLKTLCHEMVHGLLQKFTPTILDEHGRSVVIRSKNPFEHQKMLESYSDRSFVNGKPHFVFGQVKNEFQIFDGNQTPGGHMSFFMRILKNRFGQTVAEHTYYKLKM